MKSILKHMAMAATAISTTAASIGLVCGCSKSQDTQEEEKQIPKLTSINVNMPTEKIELYVNQTTTTDPISVNCLDQFGQSIESVTTLQLVGDDDSAAPSWIYITDDNCIKVDGAIANGNFNFKVYAQSEDGKVKSEFKNLLVVIKEIPLVAPDEIKVTTSVTQHETITTASYSVPLNVEITKTGVDPQYVDKGLIWSFEYLSAPKTYDSKANPLFSIVETNDGYACNISTDTDVENIGTYKFNIKATSAKDSGVYCKLYLQFEIKNGLEVVLNNLTYTRTNINSGWTLTKAPEGANTITITSDYIYQKPVVAIADNFCTNSKISLLCTLTGPATVTTIGDYACRGQQSLSVVNLPGLTTVGDYGFYGCGGMYFDTDNIPNLTSVGDYAFTECNTLKQLGKNNFTKIGEAAFKGCGLTSIIIGDHVRLINDSAFEGCTNLQSVTISRIIPPAISGGTFASCPLKTIYVPLLTLAEYQQAEVWSNYADIMVGQ